MDAERKPAQVWPLASFIAEEMEARGWDTDDVAMRMGYKTDEEFGLDLLSFGMLLCVQEDGLLVGDNLFRKMALAFDVSENYLRKLDFAWRHWPDRREPFECPEKLFGPKFTASFPTQH